MNWQSSSWCVRLKMYPEKKEECWQFFWGVFFGPFVDRMCTFLPLKGGKCRPFLFWGLFRAVCQPHVHFLLLKGVGTSLFC